MPSRAPLRGVASAHDADPDVIEEAAIEAAPADAAPASEQAPTGASRTRARPRRQDARPRLVVKGSQPTPDARLGSSGGLGELRDYPIQLSKVQAPPLRDDTLARDRLLEWLSTKIHRRAVLLVAEAGYGKTTLLADFSRRTRVRMLWFRLDRGDRDWVGFLAYLVAAVRVHVPEFGPATRGLLRETATAAPPLDTVLDTFLRELGGVPVEASALVFDDFHLVDDSPEVRHILRELLARAPDRMSFVFATRREPPIRLARLRAQGEVAELGTDDLRFDAAETEQLFRETYDLPIEPAMLAELSRRTEGWAASLQLVRSALNDRDPAQIRAFITSLSGAEGHLYDYLAEEVIGDLPDDLQQFLMRTSLLETVDLTLGPVAAGVSVEEARAFIEQGELHGLFARRSHHARHNSRLHPLVKQFLVDRLTRTVGDGGVRIVHSAIARSAEGVDWRVASRHYLASGLPARAESVVTNSIDRILATGAYEAASEVMTNIGPESSLGPTRLILASRLAQQRGLRSEGRRLAEMAWREFPDSTAVLVNLATARSHAGDVAGSITAGKLLEQAGADEMAIMARAFQRTLEASTFGSMRTASDSTAALVNTLRGGTAPHYMGVALHNLAEIQRATGMDAASLESAEEAIAHLARSSAGHELVAARLARALALAGLGRLAEGRDELAVAVETAAPGQVPELACAIAELEGFYGETHRASRILNEAIANVRPKSDFGEQLLLMRVLLLAREQHLAEAASVAKRVRPGQPHTMAGFEVRRLLLAAFVAVLSGEPADLQLDVGADLALSQGSMLWSGYAHLLRALASEANPSAAVMRVGHERAATLSMLAEALVPRLDALTLDARLLVESEIDRRPARWLEPMRRATRAEDSSVRFMASEVLVRIGEAQDVHLLRSTERSNRDRFQRRLSYDLARRLAPSVLVEDLGRVRVIVGDRAVDGSEIRRKVLALLCLLISRPKMASTREEAIDSLWPEHDPGSALNSLNQTVYFLRRVFEPEYSDDTSPGYVGQDAETIWLDAALIESRSRRCLDIIRAMPADPTPEGSIALATEYQGSFALDFAYEDWSTPYRDALHASYLRVIERAIQMDLDAGHFTRGTFLAERASEVDPDAEEVQVALVRLYKLQGAHAAAAKQYDHYAASMRALGLEPQAISEI